MQNKKQYNTSLKTRFLSGIFGTETNQKIQSNEGLTQSLTSAINNTISTLGEIKTNMVYNIKNSNLSMVPLVHRKQICIRNDGSQASLLGKQYGFDTVYKFLYVFRNTFWFSYRNNIEQIQSDNGWGCMIRSVQMLFAEVLKRNLNIKQSEQGKFKIIKHFSEDLEGIFSLASICQRGNIQKRWTSSLQIFSLFKGIFQEHKQSFNIGIEIYSNGQIYKKKQSLKLKKYPSLICLTNRVSISDIPMELRPHYFQLMKNKNFVGNIGGVKGQALYIIGHYDSKVIFLDPHYVQSNSQCLITETYFQKTPRGIEVEALSPSMCFCYYFQTFEDHMSWVQWMLKLSEKYYPNLCIELIEQRTKNKLEQKNKKKVESDDEFEVLDD